MKIPSILATILAFLSPAKAGQPQPAQLDVARMIHALADAENSDGKVGANGERGRLQFTATRWYQFSVKPHRWCGWRHPFALAETERVEREHVLDLIRECQIHRLVPTPFTIALMHATGVTGAVYSRATPQKREFAQRASNLYFDFGGK